LANLLHFGVQFAMLMVIEGSESMTNKKDTAEASPKQTVHEHSPQLDAMQVSGVQVNGAAAKASTGKTAKHVPRAFVALGVVLFVAVAVGGYIMLRPSHTSTATKQFAAPPLTVSDDAQQVVDTFANSDKSAASLQSAKDQLATMRKAATKSDDQQAYDLAVIDLEIAAGDTTTALTLATQAEDTYKSAQSAARLAGVYSAQQNYKSAADSYRLAASRSPKTAATARSAYNDYTQLAKEMDAQK
jgi:hypothetical protein